MGGRKEDRKVSRHGREGRSGRSVPFHVLVVSISFGGGDDDDNGDGDGNDSGGWGGERRGRRTSFPREEQATEAYYNDDFDFNLDSDLGLDYSDLDFDHDDRTVLSINAA